VRLAYVEELPIDQRAELAAIAREDEDPRVRRAAVAKLMDPAALASVVSGDADEHVRGKAAEMLRDIALEVFEGLAAGDAGAAVDAIDDPKALGHVAKTATSEEVARRALGRVSDARTLGSIARHAALEPVRGAALAALRDDADRDEIVAVAMNGDFKDTSLAALERVHDRETLEAIASRARNKAAARRARAVLRAAEEQDVAAAESARAASLAEQARQEHVRIVGTLEAVASSTDLQSLEHAASQAAASWPSIQEANDPELTARFTAASAFVQGRVAELRADREEADRQALAAADAARAQRQAEAADAAPAQGPDDKEVERRRVRLSELIGEAEQAAANADLSAARRRLGLIHREWKDLSAGIAIDAETLARFEAADAKLASRDTDARDLEARARRETLARMHNLLGRVEPLAANADATLKALDRALRDTRVALADIPPLPSRQEYEQILHRLKAAQAALQPRVAELREAEEWKQFANVTIQERLIVQMEALKALEDPEKIAPAIRDLQAQWKTHADVPRAQADALWRRFKAAHDELWSRCESFFAAQAQQRSASLAKKIALCERAEALATSTDWIRTADAIKALQAEWKTIGPASRGQEKAVWERFRGACDRFFTRRHEDLARRKAAWAENLGKKEALIVRAEALAVSTDWEATASELRRLQAEWKTIGPVKKSRSEAIWQRFRAACDAFFTRYAQRHDIARDERVAARQAIVAELEAFAPAAPDQSADVAAEAGDPPAGLIETMRDIRRRWSHELALRGVDRERAAELDRQFASAFGRVITRWPSVFAHTDLDPDANRRRMESLVTKVESLADSFGASSAQAESAMSPTTKLAAMLKEALAANTIGGKADEDSRARAAQEEVRQAQAAWSRIGPVPDDARRALSERFQRACARVAAASSKGGSRPGARSTPR